MGTRRLYRAGRRHALGAGLQRPKPIHGSDDGTVGRTLLGHRALAPERLLEQWGVTYVNKDLKDGRAPALIIKGPLAQAKAAAQKVMDAGNWPVGYWRDGGKGHFRSKVYLKHVRQGIVPMSYWSDEAIDEPEALGSMSWDHEHSGHSQTGFNELNALVGKGTGSRR